MPKKPKNVLLLNVGQEVRRRRKALGFTQESLAFAAGMHPNSIGRLERGVYNATVLKLDAVAKALGTDIYKLMSGAESHSA